jgi:hypothetical protein
MSISPTPVQSNHANTSSAGTSFTITLPSGITLGNLIVITITVGSNTTTLTPPDGSWQMVPCHNQPAGTNALVDASIWYLVVDSAHAGQTSWTWQLSASHTSYVCIEERNATNGWQVNPVDVSAMGDTVGSPVQATTITSGNDLAGRRTVDRVSGLQGQCANRNRHHGRLDQRWRGDACWQYDDDDAV